jgi:hypothetical protein
MCWPLFHLQHLSLILLRAYLRIFSLRPTISNKEMELEYHLRIFVLVFPVILPVNLLCFFPVYAVISEFLRGYRGILVDTLGPFVNDINVPDPDPQHCFYQIWSFQQAP